MEIGGIYMVQRKGCTTKQTVLDGIRQASSYELDDMVNAVRQRYAELFPDWEILFLSLPKNDPAERRKCLDETITMLKKYDAL